jgi:hypothetical protein
MRKVLKQYIYTARTMHYTWETYVKAYTLQEARVAGYREAKLIMGGHARIAHDEVREA